MGTIKRLMIAGGLLFAVALLAACGATSIYSTANGFSIGAPPAGTTYLLLTDTEKTEGESLEFREYSSHIERALSVKGWKRVYDYGAADQIVFAGYGIGNPQKERVSYSLPVWGQTGVSGSTTTGTITSYGNYGTVNATTNYTPTYGIKGYNQFSTTVTTYDRWLRLASVDRKAYDQTGKVNEIWKLMVSSNGSTGDLRTVFPYLSMVASRYAGDNTGKALKVTYKMDGKEYKAFVGK